MAASIGKKITTGYARQLAKNYKDQKLSKDETQAVWFSRNEIGQLLNDENVSGIRFYFGSYGTMDDHKDDPLRCDYYGRTTLIMVQTGEVIGEDECGVKVFRDILESKREKPAYPPKPLIVVEVNDGQLCPPPPLNTSQDDLLHDL
jgi:hypothetical protein